MFKLVVVTGNSMVPTLENGERVLAWTPFSKRYFRRGGIVTLSYLFMNTSADPYSYFGSCTQMTTLKQRRTELFIKRILGLPGDTVRIPVDQLTSYVLDTAGPLANQDNGDLVWQVPDGHVFVRGDGLHSSDSLTWGPIPMSQLQQIILCRFPSLKRIQ